MRHEITTYTHRIALVAAAAAATTVVAVAAAQFNGFVGPWERCGRVLTRHSGVYLVYNTNIYSLTTCVCWGLCARARAKLMFFVCMCVCGVLCLAHALACVRRDCVAVAGTS